MDIVTLNPDIFVVKGACYESLATVIVRGDEALLVDGLASAGDALALRRFVSDDLGKRVRFIISTHYMSDHMAAFPLFEGAEIIAHRLHAHTFYSQLERDAFVEPSIVFDSELTLRWGAYELELFHNPGHTMSTVNIDLRGADVLFTADNVLGNMAYISSSSPEMLLAANERLLRRRRAKLVPGHMRVLGGEAIPNSREYLGRLGDRVRAAREEGRALEGIAIESCLSPGCVASDFEREWHGRNLQVVQTRNLFAVS